MDKRGRGRASPWCRCRCATCTCRTAGATARTPRWRGVTLLHEMKARGIPVAVASDNTRDPFYAYGDLDMLEVFREATRILHLDHPSGDWPRAVARRPAEIMRSTGARHASLPAAPADFVIFRGPQLDGVAVAAGTDRIVCASGRAIDATLPDYPRARRSVMGAQCHGHRHRRLKRALDGLKIEDNPAIVKQKSRDFFWYSPVLKRELDHVTGDLVVSPKNEAEVIRVLQPATGRRAGDAARLAAPAITARRCRLSGGVVLSLAEMNTVKSIAPGRVVAGPARCLPRSTGETRADSGQEIRLHPSTYNTASVGGFIAGGSGGVGSISWGGLRDIGNVLRLRVVTMEASRACWN